MDFVCWLARMLKAVGLDVDLSQLKNERLAICVPCCFALKTQIEDILPSLTVLAFDVLLLMWWRSSSSLMDGIFLKAPALASAFTSSRALAAIPVTTTLYSEDVAADGARLARFSAVRMLQQARRRGWQIDMEKDEGC